MRECADVHSARDVSHFSLWGDETPLLSVFFYPFFFLSGPFDCVRLFLDFILIIQ
jgi:hypothetical protein